MDYERFDAVVQTLSTTGTRRGLLRLLTGLPLAGVLAAAMAPDSEARRQPHRTPSHRHASHRHHHAKAQHQPHHAPQAQAARRRHRRKKKPQCQAEAVAQTCAGTCGKVTNACGTVIDCGSCSCGGCQICQTCDAATGQCIPNGSVVGQACATCHTCTAAGQCAPVADGTACDDGNACTQTDVCQSGVCVGTNPVTCNLVPTCHTGGGTCNPATGRCEFPNGPNGTICEGGVCCNGSCCDGCCGADGTCRSDGCRGADGTCGACRAFVTSTTHTGDLGGLTGADASCQHLAMAAGLAGSYRAWLSVGTGPNESPATGRFRQSAQPYTLVDGTQIAASWAALVDGAIDHQINISELGSPVTTTSVWTNTGVDGAENTTPHDCNKWMSASFDDSGLVGQTDQSDRGWTDLVPFRCNAELRLYCFQQD